MCYKPKIRFFWPLKLVSMESVGCDVHGAFAPQASQDCRTAGISTPREACLSFRNLWPTKKHPVPTQQVKGWLMRRQGSNRSVIDDLPFNRKVAFKGTSSVVLLPLMYKWSN